MKQKILVTGAGGFIGKVVTQELLKAGYQVIAMIRPNAAMPFEPHPNLEILRADITEYSTYVNSVKDATAIVHLAANKYHPKLSYLVNLAGAQNVVRLCKENKFKTKRVINISSQSTKIKWRGVYGESKRQSDEILEQREIDWTTLKPSLVYGEGEETLFQTIAKYSLSLPVVPVIGNGKWELYPIDVVDLAQAIISCLEKPKSIHKVYDLGDPRKINFDGLVRLIQKQVGIYKPIMHVPALIGLVGVYCATKILPGLSITVDNVLGSTQNTDCRPQKAIKELGLKLTPLQSGIVKYLGSNASGRKSIIMVGLGKMGIMHSSVLQTIPGCRIVAIVDQDVTLGQTALSMGIEAKFYPSLKQALDNHRADAVFICTPTFAHKEIIDLCLSQKIPFFVEKPIYTTYDDFRELMTNGNKKVINQSASGYFWIYKREVGYVKKMIEAGKIGTITSYSVDLKHSEVFGPKSGWLFKKKLSGGGVLANPGPHAFSLIQYLFGTGEVTRSKIWYLYGNEVEDKAEIKLSHPQAIQGELKANWSIKGYPVMTIEFDIKGSKGSIKFSDNKIVIKTKSKTTTLPYYKIPRNHPVFNLNPKSGGDAYYIEDKIYIESLLNKARSSVNNIDFASKVESMISEAYEKAK